MSGTNRDRSVIGLDDHRLVDGQRLRISAGSDKEGVVDPGLAHPLSDGRKWPAKPDDAEPGADWRRTRIVLVHVSKRGPGGKFDRHTGPTEIDVVVMAPAQVNRRLRQSVV